MNGIHQKSYAYQGKPLIKGLYTPNAANSALMGMQSPLHSRKDIFGGGGEGADFIFRMRKAYEERFVLTGRD